MDTRLPHASAGLALIRDLAGVVPVVATSLDPALRHPPWPPEPAPSPTRTGSSRTSSPACTRPPVRSPSHDRAADPRVDLHRTASAVTSSSPRRTDRALVAFFVAAFVFPWTIWGSLIANEHGLLGWHLPQGLALWTLLPVTFVAVAATGGRAGLADHARRLVRWHVPARWWAVAIGLPLAFAAGATVIGAAWAAGSISARR